ncbi:MAG: cobamide remodeling phosphodiesterase CbiR [bacterium]
MGKLILITGGERSGKSRLACRIASMFSDSVTFFATAEPGDEEMRERIGRHRKSRPRAWATVEEPIRLREALERCKTNVAVVDCLTLWFSNLMHANEPEGSGRESERTVERELRALLELIARKDITVVMVTNEIGMGVIPATPLARRFVELQGMANQMVAEAAEWVIGMMSGQPVILKGDAGWKRAIQPCLAPFRIGATSYIQHADIETNVRWLSGRTEDIELVIFESEELSAYPSEEEVARLCQFAARGGFTYTVHFPLDVGIANPDPEKREAALNGWIKLSRRVRPLLPAACVVHLPVEEGQTANKDWKTLDADSLEVWRERAIAQIERMKDEDVETGIFCFENLDYPIEYLAPVVEATGCGLCIDVGHLLGKGHDLVSTYLKYRDFVRVVHFHWHDGEQDHCALPDPLPDDLRKFLQILMREQYSGVLTLEVFRESDFVQSMKALEAFFRMR